MYIVYSLILPHLPLLVLWLRLGHFALLPGWRAGWTRMRSFGRYWTCCGCYMVLLLLLLLIASFLFWLCCCCCWLVSVGALWTSSRDWSFNNNCALQIEMEIENVPKGQLIFHTGNNTQHICQPGHKNKQRDRWGERRRRKGLSRSGAGQVQRASGSSQHNNRLSCANLV